LSIGVDQKNPSLKQSQLKAGLVVQESGILDTPDYDTGYTFQFATNIPCPGTPTVTYEGQVNNTIQIFSQCWFKENLNVILHMVPFPRLRLPGCRPELRLQGQLCCVSVKVADIHYPFIQWPGLFRNHWPTFLRNEWPLVCPEYSIWIILTPYLRRFKLYQLI